MRPESVTSSDIDVPVGLLRRQVTTVDLNLELQVGAPAAVIPAIPRRLNYTNIDGARVLPAATGGWRARLPRPDGRHLLLTRACSYGTQSRYEPGSASDTCHENMTDRRLFFLDRTAAGVPLAYHADVGDRCTPHRIGLTRMHSWFASVGISRATQPACPGVRPSWHMTSPAPPFQPTHAQVLSGRFLFAGLCPGAAAPADPEPLAGCWLELQRGCAAVSIPYIENRWT